MKAPILLLIILLSLTLTAQQQPEISNDSIYPLDEVIIKGNTILGNKFVAKNRTGAAYYLSSEELAEFSHTDINRVLNKVPGVHFYEEDGFGLRPNVSIRGTSPERTSKIVIMEDGILISPAPYLNRLEVAYQPALGAFKQDNCIQQLGIVLKISDTCLSI